VRQAVGSEPFGESNEEEGRKERRKEGREETHDVSLARASWTSLEVDAP
jgi:hypothetical protein